MEGLYVDVVFLEHLVVIKKYQALVTMDKDDYFPLAALEASLRIQSDASAEEPLEWSKREVQWKIMSTK